MATIFEDSITFRKAVKFEGSITPALDLSAVEDLTVLGTADFTDAEFVPPAAQSLVKRYISQEIDASDLSAGASQSINLVAFPANVIPLGCYITTASGDAVTGSTGTTGLNAEIGIGSDPDFLMASISVFGAAGRKQGLSGVGVGGFRAADTLQLKLTATGTSPTLTDIAGLACQVHVFYVAA